MNYNNVAKAKIIEKKNKERLLKVNHGLNENSGIYFLTRVDEAGIKYAYIGQAKHLLTRLAQHLVGYQHIDLSLKSHGMYSSENPFGWKVNFIEFRESQLNEKEDYYITLYAKKGFQLRNKKRGGQCSGNDKIDEYRPARGYRDGIKQGKKDLARELKHIIDTHLTVSLRKTTKISQKALEKFNGLLDEDTYR